MRHAGVRVEVLDQPRRRVGVEVLEQPAVADVDLLALQHRGHRHHQGELGERPAVVVAHGEHGAVSVAHQRHLRRLVEQLGVRLSHVESTERRAPARGAGARAGAGPAAGGHDGRRGRGTATTPWVEGWPEGQVKRDAGKRRSSSGTTGDASRSAQTGAFITQAWCWRTKARTATATPEADPRRAAGRAWSSDRRS